MYKENVSFLHHLKRRKRNRGDLYDFDENVVTKKLRTKDLIYSYLTNKYFTSKYWNDNTNAI